MKITGQLFFNQDSISKISKHQINFFVKGMHTRMDGQAVSNMPPELFRSWGHKNVEKYPLFSSKTMVIRAAMHKMLIKIANREDPDRLI